MSGPGSETGILTEEAREFALRLEGFARTALQVLEPADVVNAFLAVTLGSLLTHMSREGAVGWLRAVADHMEAGEDSPPPRPH